MRVRKIAVYLALFVVLYGLIDQSPPIRAFVRLARLQAPRQQLGSDAVYAFLHTNPRDQQQDGLYERIRSKAEQTRIAPVNAGIDPVWKAIPGYDGQEIDVERTYRLALDRGGLRPVRAVYREMPPAVGLQDLAPAPIYKGNPHKPMASLVIHVDGGDAYLPGMLETLEKANAHATFFLDGTWLERHRQLAAEMLAAGHELANRACSDPGASAFAGSAMEAGIMKTDALLQGLRARDALFAPPSGDFDAGVVRLAAKHHLKTVLWTIDTDDRKNPSPQWIVRKVGRQLEPGSLILVHPTASADAALAGLIGEIRNRGLAVGTASELLSTKRVPDIEPPVDF